ncbi:MAG: N-acetylhexosamine 1-kinase [Gammaproteobacteria bacterium]
MTSSSANTDSQEGGAGAPLRAVLDRFALGGTLVGIEPLRRGHIHDTFLSTWEDKSAGSGAGSERGDQQRRFIHQRLNSQVFPDLDLLMRNISVVTEHIHRQVIAAESEGFEPLQLVPTRAGQPYLQSDHGNWRTYVFIERSESHDRCEGPEQAHEAARAFGWFQRQLLGLDSSELGETLPRFFSSPFRLEQFEAALAKAPEPLRLTASMAIEFALERREMVSVIDRDLRSGAIPRRIVHGDTKLNNILFDRDTGRARGIVDLDTCMPGYSLYDFGDLVRFTAATSAEDERDATLIGTDLALYSALSEGYLSMASSFLRPREIELMPFAARLVTFTIGLRFLADFLDGDRYFKTDRPEQNLDRARAQFGMVDFMERNRDAMAAS